MKKIFALVLALILMLSLAACGEKFECEECGEEKTGKKHEVEVLGEELVICDDCYEGVYKEYLEELEELGDAIADLEDLY